MQTETNDIIRCNPINQYAIQISCPRTQRNRERLLCNFCNSNHPPSRLRRQLNRKKCFLAPQAQLDRPRNRIELLLRNRRVAQRSHDTLTRLSLLIAKRLNELNNPSPTQNLFPEKHKKSVTAKKDSSTRPRILQALHKNSSVANQRLTAKTTRNKAKKVAFERFLAGS